MATNPGRNALQIPTSPRLPSATDVYDRRFTDEYSRVLGLYFRQLDAANGGLLGRQGGKFLNIPHGAFSSTITQSIVDADTPYVVDLDTIDFANGTMLNTSTVTVDQAGIYNVQFSLQFENTATHITEVWVWLRKNSFDIPGTASVWAVPGSHGAINGYLIGTCNFFVSLDAGDYIELVAAANATGINIEAYAAAVSPFERPNIPGAVLTVSFVSTKST